MKSSIKPKPADPRVFGKLWPFLRYSFFAFIASQLVLAAVGAAVLVEGRSLLQGAEKPGADAKFFAFDAVLLLNAVIAAVCAFAYLRFHYRALRNLRSIGAAGVRVTPFWTVGRYALPVVALWAPLIALRQTWRGSFAPTSGDASVPAYIGWWWALWLAINFLIAIQGKIQEKAEGLDLTLTSAALSVVNAPLFIVSAACVLRFSDAIRRAQDENVLRAAT
jgi:hypothetical protein